MFSPAAQKIREQLSIILADITPWNEEAIEITIKGYATKHKKKLRDIAPPLRAALTGTNISPGIFEVASNLGQVETLGRIADATKLSNTL